MFCHLSFLVIFRLGVLPQWHIQSPGLCYMSCLSVISFYFLAYASSLSIFFTILPLITLVMFLDSHFFSYFFSFPGSQFEPILRSRGALLLVSFSLSIWFCSISHPFNNLIFLLSSFSVLFPSCQILPTVTAWKYSNTFFFVRTVSSMIFFHYSAEVSVNISTT